MFDDSFGMLSKVLLLVVMLGVFSAIGGIAIMSRQDSDIVSAESSLETSLLETQETLMSIVPLMVIMVAFIGVATAIKGSMGSTTYDRRIQVELQNYGETIEREEGAREKAKIWLKELVGDKTFEILESGRKIMVKPDNLLSPYIMIIGLDGEFTIFDGSPDKGYVAKEGEVEEYRSGYLREDVIASVIRWFRYKPEKIINNIHCGNFAIIERGN